LIRGKKVMLDRDLAKMYGVETRILNQAVKRNKRRFPGDFMFMLSREEISRISQFVISLKFSKSVYAFTEQGIAMLSGVLNSDRAIDVNIAIMRVFVKLKEIISHHVKLANRLSELEKRMERKDEEVQAIFQAIRDLMEPPPAKRKPRIGFHQ